LRYQNVWGEGQSLSNAYTGILSIFSTLLLNGRPIEIFEDGEESRDFVHVDDVALANVLALEADGGGQHVLNVGSGIGLSVNQIVAALGDAFGRQPDARISGRYRAGDIRHNFADLDRIRAVLPGFEPRPFADGLTGFATWVCATATGMSDQQNRYGRSIVELERQGLMKQAVR
jgi:dTDP-L-rhamnose 4-epimerase